MIPNTKSILLFALLTCLTLSIYDSVCSGNTYYSSCNADSAGKSCSSGCCYNIKAVVGPITTITSSCQAFCSDVHPPLQQVSFYKCSEKSTFTNQTCKCCQKSYFPSYTLYSTIMSSMTFVVCNDGCCGSPAVGLDGSDPISAIGYQEIIGICIGGAVFISLVGVAAYYCWKKVNQVKII